MTAPFVFFCLNLLAILLLSLLRRNLLLSSVFTGLATVIMAVFVILIPLDEALTVLGISLRFDSRWIILGRSLLLDNTNRAAIGLIYLCGGILLFGAWSAKVERMFFPLGVGCLTLVAASMMIEPFLYAAVFLELTAISASIMLSSRRRGTHRGGMRLLILYTMAMLAILTVGWLLEFNQPGVQIQGMNAQVALLLGLGCAVLLSIPPFHSWLPISTGETQPFAWSFISIVMQIAGFFFIVRFLNIYPWFNENIMVFSLIRTAGAIMAIVGAIWSLVQEELPKRAGYAMLADIGVMLMAIGIGSRDATQLALFIIIARVVGVTCLALGINFLNIHPDQPNKIKARKSGRKIALPEIAIIFGMFSMAGAPLLAGFPGRWEILRLVSQIDQFALIALFLSTALLTIAAFDTIKILVSKYAGAESTRIQLIENIFLFSAIGLNVFVGIFPRIVFPWVARIIEGMPL